MPMVCSSMRVRRAVMRVTVRHYDYDCSAMEVAKVLLSDPEKGSLQWRGTTTGTIRWWGPPMPTPHLLSHNCMPSTEVHQQSCCALDLFHNLREPNPESTSSIMRADRVARGSEELAL